MDGEAGAAQEKKKKKVVTHTCREMNIRIRPPSTDRTRLTTMSRTERIGPNRSIPTRRSARRKGTGTRRDRDERNAAKSDGIWPPKSTAKSKTTTSAGKEEREEGQERGRAGMDESF